jgi:hypothetical protein
MSEACTCNFYLLHHSLAAHTNCDLDRLPSIMAGLPAHPDSIFPRNGDVELSVPAEKGIVGTLIIVVFLLMATEVVDPDVAFFGALVVCLITGILNMVSN